MYGTTGLYSIGKLDLDLYGTGGLYSIGKVDLCLCGTTYLYVILGVGLVLNSPYTKNCDTTKCIAVPTLMARPFLVGGVRKCLGTKIKGIEGPIGYWTRQKYE